MVQKKTPAGEAEQPSGTGETANFETLMGQLEGAVKKLESDDLPLEESLRVFESGILISRRCQEILDRAEKRIEILMKTHDGTPEKKPFD